MYHSFNFLLSLKLFKKRGRRRRVGKKMHQKHERKKYNIPETLKAQISRFCLGPQNPSVSGTYFGIYNWLLHFT